MSEKKQQIYNELKSSIWQVDFYMQLEERKLVEPIQKYGQNACEIIGELILWDQFVMKKRLPYFVDQRPLPVVLEVEQVNRELNDLLKKLPPYEILYQFKRVRKMLLNQFNAISKDVLNQDIRIGTEHKSVLTYFYEMIEYDHQSFHKIDELVDSYSI